MTQTGLKLHFCGWSKSVSYLWVTSTSVSNLYIVTFVGQGKQTTCWPPEWQAGQDRDHQTTDTCTYVGWLNSLVSRLIVGITNKPGPMWIKRLADILSRRSPLTSCITTVMIIPASVGKNGNYTLSLWWDLSYSHYRPLVLCFYVCVHILSDRVPCVTCSGQTQTIEVVGVFPLVELGTRLGRTSQRILAIPTDSHSSVEHTSWWWRCVFSHTTNLHSLLFC